MTRQQEAIDWVVEQNRRIQNEITEVQKEREEKQKAIARIKQITLELLV